MHYLIAIAFSAACVTVFATLTASKSRKDRIVIEAARDVANCPTCNTLGALKTAIQLYDEGQL